MSVDLEMPPLIRPSMSVMEKGTIPPNPDVESQQNQRTQAIEIPAGVLSFNFSFCMLVLKIHMHVF